MNDWNKTHTNLKSMVCWTCDGTPTPIQKQTRLVKNKEGLFLSLPHPTSALLYERQYFRNWELI